eukprot:CAMPEP_0172714562 /NCGR_PEP_ID=MMETSP1074-20121228/66157_1 /TAXON_ID=2916 /ORGANISM="Ceratium fusus, Strain PA161109" /LENGTH=80 /DNA_ID=CAMNT_0013539005 /DNA_START=435 /DNA_END=674 /DNA_ORIENTATION=+
MPARSSELTEHPMGIMNLPAEDFLLIAGDDHACSPSPQTPSSDRRRCGPKTVRDLVLASIQRSGTAAVECVAAPAPPGKH